MERQDSGQKKKFMLYMTPHLHEVMMRLARQSYMSANGFCLQAIEAKIRQVEAARTEKNKGQ